ncbi:hypothetical protein Pan97_02710 [Bremerella volcania]|uniref:Leucine Rich repeats (2 copies) n=1 Tax=Bremerella volcania TaxID=2527984 RepID=A0A518C262_9BACT|nr:hypothetical protein [Bremerella volcania]QDU73302.1 hypothetical protein Pan97_02710 [Bremerella volcania]
MKHRAATTEDITAQSPRLRSWCVRWSMRGLIVATALACILCGWISYRYRVGRLHEDVATQLLILQAPRPKHRIFNNSPIQLDWNLEETKRVIDPPPGVAAVTGATDLTIAYDVQVRYTPRWMEMTSSGPVFQRLKGIRLTPYIHPDVMRKVLDQIARLDGQVPISIDMPRMHQDLMEDIFTKTQVHTFDARFAKLEPGPLPFLKNSGLVELCLCHTWFSDAAASDLPDTLVSLDLERTAVTDAALPEFARLHRLQYLNLRRTPTSEAAIEKLREAMPECQIAWEPLRN